MGSAAELNQFLLSVEKRAFAMAVVSVKNRDDALDIVQDVMMTLARKYADKPANEWPPLFFRILRNRVTDHHRSGTVRRRIFGWFADQEPADIEELQGHVQENPDFQHSVSGLRDRLTDALGQLPKRQQQAFMLRVWEGLSVRDTAKAMRCSEGSVKTHLSRANSSLRSLLPEYEDGIDENK